VGVEFVRRVYWLRDAGLGGSRKAVLANVAHHAGHKNRKCRLKYATIAAELGVSVRVVGSAVPWLDANGYIARGERTRRKDGTLGAFTFTLLPPAISAAGPPADTAENHRQILPRSNQLQEPTASSSTPPETAEGEEAGEPFEGRATS
jgi:hypothetical protein